MKGAPLGRWGTDPVVEGMLFFAQVADGLLFDYSLDSYKVPCTNTHVLVVELLLFLDEVESGEVYPSSVNHIIDELNWNLRHDPVAKALLGPVWRYAKSDAEIIPKLATDNLRDVRTIAGLLDRYLTPQAEYLEETKRQLLSVIDSVKEKQKIRDLARILIPELISVGYSKGYIYYQLYRHFAGGVGGRITNTSLMKQFLDLFSNKEESWDVVFRGSSTLQLLSKLSSSLAAEVKTSPPEARTTLKKEQKFLQGHTGVFVVCRGVAARDYLAARDIAYRQLMVLAEIAGFYAHRIKFEIQERVLIYSSTNSDIYILEDQQKAVLKRPDLKGGDLDRSKRKAIETLGGLPSRTRGRLVVALNLHRLAIETDSEKNQLVNLWTAIETLVPAFADTNNKIDKAVRTLVPVLANQHVAHLLSDLLAGLNQWNGNVTRTVLARVVEGQSDVEKLAALLVLDSYGKDWEDLSAQITMNPFLRWKLWRLATLCSKPRICST